MSDKQKHAVGSNKFEEQHKEAQETKKSHKDQVKIKEWTDKKKEAALLKGFDRHDPDQMEGLKKRDIKRYRKECRKIKREIREKQGLPVGVQVQPKPIRAPEEIKERKQEMFAKISNKKQKLAGNDYQNVVDQNDAETMVSFVTSNMTKHISTRKPTEGEGAEALNAAIRDIESRANQLIGKGNIQAVKDEEKDPNLRVINEVNKVISELRVQENQGTKRYNVPQVLVICPDTYNVVDVNKELVAAYKNASGIGESGQKSGYKYDIHIQKLFAKHIKPSEQAELLSKKHPNAKQKRVLNVYVGTPNRLLKLSEMKAFDIGIQSDRFRNIIIDCRLSKKNITIFETRETRNDTLDLMALCNTAFSRVGENKLKLSLV